MLWRGAGIDFSPYAHTIPRAENCIFRSVLLWPTSTLLMFEQALFRPFTIIIQHDIECEFIMPSALAILCWLGMSAEYVPYLSEIHVQMLELHTTYVSTDYHRLFLLFLQTQQKARALVRDAKQMVATDLGVIQQRSILSKINDVCGILRPVTQNIEMWAHFSVVVSAGALLMIQCRPGIILQSTRCQLASAVADKQDESICLHRIFLYFSPWRSKWTASRWTVSSIPSRKSNPRKLFLNLSAGFSVDDGLHANPLVVYSSTTHVCLFKQRPTVVFPELD